jgi:hypothetical protein
VRIMNELPKTIAEAAQKVHKAANASSAEDFLAVLEVCYSVTLAGSVADPNPDPHVFGPPGSGSGSFYY